MYQRLVLVGNLGRDPEMHYSTDGTPITNFPVATSRKWTDSEGQLQEETTWFRVAVYGRQAENCIQFLGKGQKVLVEGTLVSDGNTGGPRVYTRKDGNPGASFEVRASSVRFLSTKAEREEVATTAAPATAGTAAAGDDEYPF